MKKSLFFSFLILVMMSVFIVPAAMQDATSAPITFSGTVEAIEGSTITITGLKVDVSGLETTLVSQIQTGVTVNVTGTLTNGVVTATVITLTSVTPPTQGQAQANYSVVFSGRNFDGASTTFTYIVTGTGAPPALSHFDIEIPSCTPALQVTGYTPTSAVELGVDPTTGVSGIKWDTGLGEGESRTYSITFLGDVAEGNVVAAVKGGNGFFTVVVKGPACAQPALDVEKYISLDNQATWLDADAAPGVDARLDGQVFFRFIVTNKGTSDLTNITLTDNKMDLTPCVKPATLAVGAFFECVVGPLPVTAGQHSNTATAQATFANGTTVSDTDLAHYFGGDRPAIDVEVSVSSNGGAAWIDADNAPGLPVEIGLAVSYRFVVKNTGNVALTNLTLSDSAYNTSTCAIPTTLEPGSSFTCDVAGSPATDGLHSNTTTATGVANSVTVTDTDTTHYTGGDDDDTDVIIIIEGPVEKININIITIFGIDIELNANDPILTTIKIGDYLRIEGTSVGRGDVIIIVAITVVVVDIDIIVPPSGGGGGGSGRKDCFINGAGKTVCPGNNNSKKKSKKSS